MKKSWVLDAAIGLALTLGVAACYILPGAFSTLESLELKSYDARSKLRQNLDPAPDVVLVAIDDSSIAQLGRWPWPRSRLAEMIDKLKTAQAKVVGLNILLSEPEQNQGLLEIQALKQRFEEQTAARKIIDKSDPGFTEEFSAAAVRLDSDSKLLASLQSAANVTLPMFFSLGVAGGRVDELPASISSAAMTQQVTADGAGAEAIEATKAVVPVAAFADHSRGAGHVNISTDFDGVVRRETPAIKYGDSFYPSYAVALAMSYLGLAPSDAQISPGRSLTLGKASIPLDQENKMAITFSGPVDTFRYFSFHDVMKMDPQAASDLFKDKLVILGPTAPGIATLYVTPVAAEFPAIELIANVIGNILRQQFLKRPDWAANAELGMIGFIGLFIMFALPRLKALWGFIVSVLLFTALMAAGVYLFVNGDWLKVTYPCALLGAGYLLIVSKGLFLTEKGKELVEASAIETNKMLGLSFQGQGMLDMAFEKFRLCPLDDNMKETLYNLAIDFERKRQYAKAVSVLGLVSAKDPKFKDIAEKMKVLKQASEGAVFGPIGGGKEGTVMIAGGSTKPTLGRYEIEKELGRGAMGVVYLGKDPKINRMVAIKTMMLGEGTDAAETKEVKERFFREAESAGTLNHPNIVRIFDAGDEQDVSYIAMELLDGQDLTRFTAKDKLLPYETAMEYVATVADALDYAHAQGIVHRDIKPANIMLLKDGTIRVADFGIARITASSKTATGTVMGTPSYMSPEQLAGKKVDGRADLFSLGVALFEFLTGQKPFAADAIGTLLFQIANDPHPDPRTINPAIPPAAVAVINKALAKNPDQRYARGAQMAADIRAALKAGGAAAPAVESAPVPAPAAPAEPPAAQEPPSPQGGISPLPEGADATVPQISAEAFAAALGASEATLTAGAPPPAETTQPTAPLPAESPSPDATIRLAPAEAPVPTEPTIPGAPPPGLLSIQLSPAPPPPAPPAGDEAASGTIQLNPPPPFEKKK